MVSWIYLIFLTLMAAGCLPRGSDSATPFPSETISVTRKVTVAPSDPLLASESLPSETDLLPEFTRTPAEASSTPSPSLPESGWRQHANMLTPRSEMPAAFLDGQIYVPGGFGGESAFEGYDPALDTWDVLPPLPDGRNHHMAVAYQGLIYVFGGGNSAAGNEPTDTAWAFDPVNDEWKEVARMPEARIAGAAVVLGDYIYVVGGGGSTGALLRYDPAADSWERLASLAQLRNHTAAVALDGKIYALAGRWQGQGVLASVEIYTPEQDLWSPGPAMNTARAGHGAGILDGKIFVFGGEVLDSGRVTLDSVEVFDPLVGEWAYSTPLPVPLHGVPAVAVGEFLYIIGGSDLAGAIENRGRVLSWRP